MCRGGPACPPNDDAGVSGQTHRSAPTDGIASTVFEQTRPPNDDAGVSGQTHRSAPTDGTASTVFEQTRPPNDDAGVSGQTHRSAPTDGTASTGFGRAAPAPTGGTTCRYTIAWGYCGYTRLFHHMNADCE